MPVFRSTYNAVVEERDRVLGENSDLREQVKKLTDTLAIAQKLPMPFYARPGVPIKVTRGVETIAKRGQRLEALQRKKASDQEN